MKNYSAKLINAKLFFLYLFGILLLTNCQSSSVRSQVETNADLKPVAKNMKLEDLEKLKWRNRIILVGEDGKKGLKNLRDAVEEINERDVIWFRLNDGKIETNYNGELAEDFADKLNENYFNKFSENVFLIGKDGTIKSKDNKLDLRNYFGQIDSMPMRQQEMKQDQK